MSESVVNGAMYVRFEASSDVVSCACFAVGGILSSSAAAYDCTQWLAGRSVSFYVLYHFIIIFCF